MKKIIKSGQRFERKAYNSNDEAPHRTRPTIQARVIEDKGNIAPDQRRPAVG